MTEKKRAHYRLNVEYRQIIVFDEDNDDAAIERAKRILSAPNMISPEEGDIHQSYYRLERYNNLGMGPALVYVTEQNLDGPLAS